MIQNIIGWSIIILFGIIVFAGVAKSAGSIKNAIIVIIISIILVAMYFIGFGLVTNDPVILRWFRLQ